MQTPTPQNSLKDKMILLIKQVLFSVRSVGFFGTSKKIVRRILSKLRRKKVWNFSISKRIRKKQAKHQFQNNTKISILVPLYNTPKVFLNELIASVRRQTYINWELCLADGSDIAHTYIEEICTKLAMMDHRIVYRKLRENKGISENTNACMQIATGSYFALLDHDDMLHDSALFEVAKAIDEKKADLIYTDEITFASSLKKAYCPNFKPDYAPDTLRSQNYICHLTVFSRKLIEKVGPLRTQFNGSQDYDLLLRLTEAAERIVHIPKILYFWRASESSVALDVNNKPYVVEAAKAAIAEHLLRIGIDGVVENSSLLTTYRIRYKILDKPMVSIVIPNKDHISDLKRCIDSILTYTTYSNYEILIVENNSQNKETFYYYEELHKKHDNIKIIAWEGTKFNFSAINNFGFQYTCGEYIVLLNNDILVISPDWLQEMLMFAQRKDVGAVGAMLYYPDDTIQHAGVILGIGGVAGHAHKYFKRGDTGYMGRITFAQDLSAVTAACMMLPRQVFSEVQGLDENFEVAFNDVDLCMRIRKAGYLIVFTPYAELYHCESKSRGFENTEEKRKRFQGEVLRFMDKWDQELKEGDPYYNPNLTLGAEDFSLRI